MHHLHHQQKQDFFRPARLVWFAGSEMPVSYERKPNTAENISKDPEPFLKGLDAAIAELDQQILQHQKDPQLMGQVDTPKKIAILNECKAQLISVQGKVRELKASPQNAELKKQLDTLLQSMAIQLCRPMFAEAYKSAAYFERLPATDFSLHQSLQVLMQNPQKLQEMTKFLIDVAEPEVIQRVVLNVLPLIPADILKGAMIDLVKYIPLADLRSMAKLVAGPLFAGMVDLMPEANLRDTAFRYISSPAINPYILARDSLLRIPAGDMKSVLGRFVSLNDPKVLTWMLRPPLLSPQLVTGIVISALKNSRLQ